MCNKALHLIFNRPTPCSIWCIQSISTTIATWINMELPITNQTNGVMWSILIFTIAVIWGTTSVNFGRTRYLSFLLETTPNYCDFYQQNVYLQINERIKNAIERQKVWKKRVRQLKQKQKKRRFGTNSHDLRWLLFFYSCT